MIEFKKYKLGDIADIIVSTVDKKSKAGQKEVRLCNFVDVYRNWAITNDLYDDFMVATASDVEIKRFKLKKGQVAFTKDSETRDDIGIATYIAEDFDDVVLGYHTALVTPNEDIILGKYLNAFMHSKYIMKYFEMNATGSGMRYTLSIDTLNDIPILVPSLEEQKRIGDFFSDIDKKICLNRRINRSLQAYADQVYDYWFVQYDFPDANGRPYKSSGGKMEYNSTLKREIPEGWEVHSLGSCTKCLLGGTPSRQNSEYWGGDINWINSGKVNDFRVSTPSEMITSLGLKNTSTYLMPRNTVVIAITGATMGQVSLLNIEACGNQSIVGVLETDEIRAEFLYPMVVRYIPFLVANKAGAAQPHVNKQNIEEISFALPPKAILEGYYKLIRDSYDTIMQLENETLELIHLKDFILPKVITGQVSFIQ